GLRSRAAPARADPQRARVPPDLRDPRGPAAAHGQRAARHERRERGDPPALLPDQRRTELGRGDDVNRLRIKHITGFHYGGDVTASYNEARMLPVSAEGQLVLFSNLEILP